MSDFIAGNNDKETAGERLTTTIQNAKPYIPPKKKTLEDIILTTTEFKALDIPPRKIYLDPWLKGDSITLASGWRGVGKTWFSWSIADAVTKKKSFGPWKCDNPVPVLILDGEMPASDLVERIGALRLDSDRSCPLYIYSDALANQFGIPSAQLASESWRDKMKSILSAARQ